MKSWTLILCGLLTACASTNATQQRWEHAEAEAAECDDPGADRCTLFLCGVGACGLYYCEDVKPGSIVRAQAMAPMVPPVAPPMPVVVAEPFSAPGNPNPYWGSMRGLPGDAEPIFIIPWNQTSEEYAARLKQQAEDPNKDRRVWAKHHVFPQEFVVWFTRRGIKIHDWTLVLEKHVHERIHRGERGGPWNAAWRQYIEDNRAAGKQAIHLFAMQLIFRFELSGPIVPYNGKKTIPVFPLAEEDIY
jgi:uncharacterized lipoprotein (TIGR02269 family)